VAISVDWENKIIHVNKIDMVLLQSVPSVIYQLDLDVFRKTLNDLQDDEAGMPFLTTHSHNTTVEVGGAILARVVQIINGYTVTFEDGQYRVNTVGANSNIGEVINVNQVSVSTSNSAGLQDLNSLQAASFAGEVSLDIVSAYSGTIFPVGTRQFPVNNTADARAIAEERGLKAIRIMSSMTFDTEVWAEGHVFVGDTITSTLLTLDPGAGVVNAEFKNLRITGTLDGGSVLRDCLLLDINFVNGFIHQCALGGTITMGGSTQLTIMDSFSNVPGGGAGQTPTLDMNGSGHNVALRNWSGGLDVINCSDTITSMDFVSGRVTFDATVTGGAFWVRGDCTIEDSSTGGSIVDMTVNKLAADNLKLSANKAVIAPDDLSVEVFEDDGVTVFKAFDISPDKRTRTPS